MGLVSINGQPDWKQPKKHACLLGLSQKMVDVMGDSDAAAVFFSGLGQVIVIFVSFVVRVEERRAKSLIKTDKKPICWPFVRARHRT